MKTFVLIFTLLVTAATLAQTPNSNSQSSVSSENKPAEKSYFNVFVEGSVKCYKKPTKPEADKCVKTLHLCEIVTSSTKDVIELQKCVDSL